MENYSTRSTSTNVTLLTSLPMPLWASSPHISKNIYFGHGIVRAKMHIPRAGERVYVDELSRIFVVAWVDDETQTVDLVPSTGSTPREEYVPWQKLFRCWTSPTERVNATPGLVQRYRHRPSHERAFPVLRQKMPTILP